MSIVGRDMYSTMDLQRKEASYFDSLAAIRDLSIRAKRIETDTTFPHVSAAGNRHICNFLGSLDGKRALDVGCGAGFSTVLLAKKGCRVCAIDISETFVNLVHKSVHKYDVESRIETICKMGAEHLEFDDEYFDVVWCGDILHHTKLECAMPEIARVMKHGARGVFVETLGTNPVFLLFRQHVAGHFGIPKCGTETEFPIRGHELKFIASHFRSCQLRGDAMFDVMHNYLFTSASMHRFTRAADGFLFTAFPWLSKAAYQGIITVMK